MSRLTRQLKELKHLSSINPTTDWLLRGRTELLKTITKDEGAQMTSKPSVSGFFRGVFATFIPARALLSVQRVGVVALTVLVTAYGWGVGVSAAQNSLPGDLLYSVKIAEEKRELLVAASDKEKVELLLGHASKRANELKQIHNETHDEVKKQKQAKAVVDSLKKNITIATEELQKVKTGGEDGDALAAVAVSVEQKTDQIARDLALTPEVAKTSVAEAVSLVLDSNVQASLVVAEALLLPREPAVSVPETIVPQGKVPQEVIEEHLEKTIVSLEHNLAGLSIQVMATDTASGTAFIAPALVASTTPVAPPVSSTNTASTGDASISTAVSSTTGTLSLDVPAVAASSTTSTLTQTEKTTDIMQAAGQALVEAKAALKKNDLKEALQKIQMVYTLAKSAHIEAETIAKLILPIVDTSTTTSGTVKLTEIISGVSASPTTAIVTPVTNASPTLPLPTTSTLQMKRE